MSKFLNEFKEFAMKGNVIDMAVGVIIGGAFGKIVSSLVDNVLMPIFGVLTGGVDFSGLSVKFNDASIQYGLFIQNVIDFLIIAFCIFLFVKALNKFKKKLTPLQLRPRNQAPRRNCLPRFATCSSSKARANDCRRLLNQRLLLPSN